MARTSAGRWKSLAKSLDFESESDRSGVRDSWQSFKWPLDSSVRRDIRQARQKEAIEKMESLQEAHQKAQRFVDEEIPAGKKLVKQSSVMDSLTQPAQEAVQELFKMWEGITAQDLVTVLAYLGPDDSRLFFKSLTLKVWHPADSVRRQHMSFVMNAVRGSFSFRAEHIDSEELHEFSMMSPAAKCTLCCPLLGVHALFDWLYSYLCFPSGVQEVNTSYTRVEFLRMCDQKDVAYVLGALLDCNSRVFNNPFVNAIVAEAWERLRPDYVASRISDVVLLVSLAYWGKQEHEVPKRTPSLPSLLLVVMLSLWRLLLVCAQMQTSWSMYGLKRACIQRFSHWGMTIAFVEAYTTVGMIAFALSYVDAADQTCHWDHSKNAERLCMMAAHPIFFSMLVFFKWLQLIMYLLCTSFFGTTVLPAFNAVLGQDSTRFMFFLGLFWVGTVHAYAVFPIAEHHDGGGMFGKGFLTMLMKVFRLDFLGDFDLEELEGFDTKFEGSIINGTLATESVDRVSDLYHRGILIFLLGCSIFFTILMLNVYISVLGAEYMKEKENSVLGALKLRTQFMVEHLQVRLAFPNLSNFRLVVPFEDHGRPEKPWDGMWILYTDKATAVAPDEAVQDSVDQMAARMVAFEGAISERLERIEKALGVAAPPSGHGQGPARGQSGGPGSW